MMKKHWMGTLCALVFWLASGASAEVFYAAPPESWQNKTLLEWTIFDVDEADAMLLTCAGESMMVDGGTQPFQNQLAQALEERGLRQMRYYLNTHYHEDHIDGLWRLLVNGFSADSYMHAYGESAVESSARCKRTVQQAKANGMSIRRLMHGDSFLLGDARVEVMQCTQIANVNARSLVLRVSFGESSLLLCADITGQAQKWFLKNVALLDADLIKLPHHGITPAVPEFLDAVSPDAAVITNRKNGVESKSIAQLDSRKIPAFFAGDGTVYAATDGVDWYVVQPPEKF